ncbi:NAD(P)H-dependent oxidoreductase [bacterium]|nr:NAD(P)H-dependent oxidoreductase [bacterium]
MSSFLNNLEWRFATKSFDKTKRVKSNDLNQILEAIRMAPTSFGIQPFQIYVVKDQKLKDKLKLNSFLQPQVSDCSHLLVFCEDTDIKNKIKAYIKESGKGKGLKDKVSLKASQARVTAWLSGLSKEQANNWAKNQTYITLGFALAACAELRVDSCPMEGFISNSVNKILKLPKSQNSVAFLALGYRADEPKSKKVRLSKSVLFTNI